MHASDAVAPGVTPEPPRTPWKRAKRPGQFAGDVAIVNLRDKLALVPQRLPEPPPPTPTSGDVKYRLAIRLVGVAVVAAVGAIGYRLGSTRSDSPPRLALSSSHSSDESVPIRVLPSSSSASPAVAIVRALHEQPSPGGAFSPPGAGRITVGGMLPLQSDEAARLKVSVADAGPDAAVVIGGLPPGSALSTGTQVGPNAWRLSVEDLATAAVTPPRGFAGAFDLTLELRLANGTVADRTSVRLEWPGGSAAGPAGSPAKSQTQQLDAGEIAQMVKSGAGYMANGNIGAARMILQPAAEAGDPVAAFALAETYDPVVLGKLNVQGGITADVRLAQIWYQKAKKLGSVAATERLERLAR